MNRLNVAVIGCGFWGRNHARIYNDLGNVSLVAVAEALDVTRIFTLDRDFQIYRWKGRRKFAVVP